MPTYAVCLGNMCGITQIEADSPQDALNKTIASLQENQIAQIPRKDLPESRWFSRNIASSKDELWVTDPDSARNIISNIRADCAEIFWFVPMTAENKKIKKLYKK